jgi:hypothetical protein
MTCRIKIHIIGLSLMPIVIPSADYAPIKDIDRVGASDPMTALLVYIGGTGATTVPQACERTVAIFDGHTRYNLRLAFERFGMAHPNEGYRDRSWCARRSSSRLPDTILSIFCHLPRRAARYGDLAGTPSATRLLVPYRASISTPMGNWYSGGNKVCIYPFRGKCARRSLNQFWRRRLHAPIECGDRPLSPNCAYQGTDPDYLNSRSTSRAPLQQARILAS